MVKKNIKYLKKNNSHKHATRHRAKSSNGWQILSVLLGIALIASIMTGGFTLKDPVQKSIDAIDKAIDSSVNTDLKAKLTDAKQILLEAVKKEEQNINNNDKTIDKADKNTDVIADKPVLDLYVMSICPFGVKVENQLKPVIDDMGDYFTLNLEYIVTDNNGKFSSLHGQPEVDGDKVQLCAKKYSKGYEYFDMIYCMNQQATKIPDNWETCAKDAGLDVDKIKTCFEGNEGIDLLKETAKTSREAGATGSPTIYLNGESFGKSGATTTADFKRGICNALDTKPDTCNDIPVCSSDDDCKKEGKIGVCNNAGTSDAKCTFIDPVAVDLTVINDKLCTNCDTSGAIQTSEGLFKGLSVEKIDYEDAKAKKLMSELNIEVLPAYVFSKSVKDARNFERVAQFFTAVKDYYVLSPSATGANHDPLKEICDNGVDDRDNDGLIDCADDECADTMECRKEKNNTLDVFVMSQCPYGTRALDAMKEVLDNFKDIEFNVHYIASKNADGTFSSLHGQAEVDENIRELCAIKHFPDNYMDYIWCRNKNIKSSDWEACATGAIDKDVMKTCFEGDEGKALLAEDIKIANSLGIGASPTWLVNNRYKFSGIDSDTIKQNLCAHNPNLENCDKTLSTDTTVSGSCN